MAVGKSIWKKSSIQWLDNVIKKAKDMINKDKEVTLEDVATDIDNWTTTTVENETTTPTVNETVVPTTTLWWWLEWIWITPSATATDSTTTVTPVTIWSIWWSDVLPPQGWNIGDKIQELVQANNLDLQSSPELLARRMANEWYQYNTTPIGTNKYENETKGMTVEEAAQYIEQKNREEKEAQDAYNREVDKRFDELTTDTLLKRDKETAAFASNLIESQEPWLIDSIVDAMSLWRAWNKAERQADITLTSYVLSDPRHVKNSKYSVNQWDWEEEMTHDEFFDSLRQYVDELNAYERWEIWEKPNKTFTFWTTVFNASNPYSKDIERKTVLDDKSIRNVVNVYNETLEWQTKDTIIEKERQQNLRDWLWLTDNEEVQEIDWVYKIVRSKREDRVNETNELAEQWMESIVQRYRNDPNFAKQNSARQMLNYQYSFWLVSETAQDTVSHLARIDEFIDAIDNWTWKFDSEEQRLRVRDQMIGIRDSAMNNVAKPFIMNSSDIIWITSQFAWDEKTLIREYAKKAWVSEDWRLDYTILSDAYFSWIEEPERFLAWYDVENRLFNAFKPYIDEAERLAQRNWGMGFLQTQRHDLSAWLENIGQALEWAREPFWFVMDLVFDDAGKMAAGTTQLWVFKKDYDLAWDAWRFIYSVEWKLPEVASFAVWWTSWAVGKWWKLITWASRVEKALSKAAKITNVAERAAAEAEAMKKYTRLWKVVNRISSSMSSTTRNLNEIRKLGESEQDIAKAEQLLTKTVLRNRTLKTFWEVSKDIIESVRQDWAFFNRWDTEQYTNEQDKWTVYWALFSFANLDLLSMTWGGLKKFSMEAVDLASRGLWNAALSATSTFLDKWVGSKVIDKLVNVASKWIGKGKMVTWTTVDLLSYFYDHPSELSIAMLKSMWYDTVSFINVLKNASKDDITQISRFLDITWQSLFQQSQEAAKILNLIKRNDPTWLVAMWEKQYVAAMLSTFLRWQNSVNAQEVARMIENSKYTVPDMIKRFYNTPWTLLHNDGSSNLFLQIDSVKMNQVDYPRELDFIDRNSNQFTPAKTWTDDDITYARRELERMNSEMKDVFDIANIDKNFVDLWDWKYMLSKEWLETLWYKNNKLIPEVVAQLSDNTKDFVSKLREINESNGVEVLSEKLISDIEQTDAYDRLSSQLWDFLC